MALSAVRCQAAHGAEAPATSAASWIEKKRKKKKTKKKKKKKEKKKKGKEINKKIKK